MTASSTSYETMALVPLKFSVSWPLQAAVVLMENVENFRHLRETC